MSGSSVGGIIEINKINKIKVEKNIKDWVVTKTTAFVPKIFILGHFELNYANDSKKSLILGILGHFGSKIHFEWPEKEEPSKDTQDNQTGLKKKSKDFRYPDIFQHYPTYIPRLPDISRHISRDYPKCRVASGNVGVRCVCVCLFD